MCIRDRVRVITGTARGCDFDVNGDAQVNINDLVFVLGAFGRYERFADFDLDRVIDIDDLVLVLGAFGTDCF